VTCYPLLTSKGRLCRYHPKSHQKHSRCRSVLLQLLALAAEFISSSSVCAIPAKYRLCACNPAVIGETAANAGYLIMQNMLHARVCMQGDRMPTIQAVAYKSLYCHKCT
jgi:hypothetical protein